MAAYDNLIQTSLHCPDPVADTPHSSSSNLRHGREHPGSCLRERDPESSQEDASGRVSGSSREFAVQHFHSSS